MELLDLLREPIRISNASLSRRGSTYGFASSIYGLSLIFVSHHPADLMYAPTVVGAAHDPRQLVVEEDSADVVQVAVQREQTPPGLVGPDLDLVIIAARDEPVRSQYTPATSQSYTWNAHNGCVL